MFAALCGALAATTLALSWITFTTMTGRYFSWIALAIAPLIGLVVRYTGYGIEKRYAFLAGALAIAAIVVGSAMEAPIVWSREYGVSALVLRSQMNLRDYLEGLLAMADLWGVAMVLAGASFAAFFSLRKLNKEDAHSVWAVRMFDLDA